MMATERAAQIYAETRAACGVFLDAWHKLQDARDAYNAVGGEPFFTEFFATPQELTIAELVAVMTSTDAIDALMANGHSTNLHKARG
jgi:hypothetical protein